MFRDFINLRNLNRSINVLLMLFVAAFVWGWLGEIGFPIAIVIGIGAILLVAEFSEFSNDPPPKSVLLGGLICPFWPVLRFWIQRP